MQPGMVIMHVEGGEGTIVLVRDDEILVEWGDLSRTWEERRYLRVLN